ncbi:MAG: ferritin-like domain-containing protein [Anaerolineae bacterium]
MVSEQVKEIIQQAIKTEEASYALYTSASARLKDPAAKAGLADLAKQEKQHKAKLEGLLAGDLDWAVKLSRREEVRDLQIGEFLEARPLTAESDLQDVLIVAMKREEATAAFYTQMAKLVEPGPVKSLFEMLATEEVKHKKYVESIYEDVVYKEF